MTSDMPRAGGLPLAEKTGVLVSGCLQLRWAALLGNTDGMLLLSGILKEQGDHDVARNWLQKAADLGDPRAVEALAGTSFPAHGEVNHLGDMSLVD